MQLSQKGFELDLGLLLKNLVVFATGQSRFLTVGKLSMDTLQKAWKDSCTGLEFALNFLKNNAGIDSPALLSSPSIMITLAYHGYRRDYQINSSESERLRFWLLIANAKGRYSRGSSETLLDQDLSTLKNEKGATELIDRLRSQVGRLDITLDELEGRNRRSALFKTMFLAFRAASAKDWRSNIAIALDLSGKQHKLQFHHIFPKAILKKKYQDREADDIANLSFIGGKTNRAISDKSPSEYFPTYVEKSGQATFDAQCIPTDEKFLKVENFKEFVVRRRELIVERLNDFLGVKSGI